MGEIAGSVNVSERGLIGLLAIYRYRYLSIAQFAKASGLKETFVREILREYERKGFLGAIGNVGIRGQGKTPKLYYLTKKGYELILEASGREEDELGSYKAASTSARWSPIMYHRLATVDLMLAVEAGVMALPDYRLVEMFLEYRREKRAGKMTPETSDYVETPEIPANRLVPDAAFILENVSTGKRGLFFIETDMGTERITTASSEAYSLAEKFRQYERYLTGGQFAKTYAPFGVFRFFTALFVTTTLGRIENIRAGLPSRPDLHPYFRFAVFEDAKEDFFGAVWVSRDVGDLTRGRVVSGDIGKRA